MSIENEAAVLAKHVTNCLGREWRDWPGGYPQAIELCLIDAVLSIRSRYGGPDTGVRQRTATWREFRAPKPADDLEFLGGVPVTDLAARLDNRQKLSGGLSKAEGIVDAAAALSKAGMRHAADVDPANDAFKRAYTSIKGLGWVTFDYFLMLNGRPGFKVDVWVLRFVNEALHRKVTAAEARPILMATAARLGRDPSQLDHAIWAYARSAARL